MTATATAPEDGAAPPPEDEAANAPNETGAANAPSSARAVEPKVREDLLAELTEIMGFNRNKAVRALYFSQADSAERAIDWIERHEEDADVNEPLLIEDESSAAKGVKTVSKMTAEEAKAKADESCEETRRRKRRNDCWRNERWNDCENKSEFEAGKSSSRRRNWRMS